jgi:hypothetical protein
MNRRRAAKKPEMKLRFPPARERSVSDVFVDQTLRFLGE